MSKAVLLELADRVEKASGRDDTLNRDIATALGWTFGSAYYVKSPDGTPHGVLPNWTSSLDSAMTLVPDGHLWIMDSWAARGWSAGVWKTGSGRWSIDASRQRQQATPALALTAAALRARAQQESTDA